MATTNLIMPSSPIVDARGNAQPEWREYLSATREAARLLKALVANAGGATGLEERIAALLKRIEGLSSIAIGGDRLVMWRGPPEISGSVAIFRHDLGTRNVFWHIWDTASKETFAGGLARIQADESRIELIDDEFGNPVATLDAVVIGVISDRY